MVIDPEALAEAFDKVAKDRLMKEIREWVVYTAPPHIHELYRTYLDIVERKTTEELFG